MHWLDQVRFLLPTGEWSARALWERHVAALLAHWANAIFLLRLAAIQPWD